MISIKLNKYQLEIYEKLGATTNSELSYTAIKNVLKNITDFRYDIYLQGSYANKTNIYGDSDVDVIIELKDIFGHNINKLPKEDQDKFNNKYGDSKISITDFYSSVLNVLNDSNYNYQRKNKCLKISGTRLNVDLVVCNSYRNYTRYPYFVEGVKVYTLNNENVISYPKLHKENGALKNNQANGNFKKTVRIFKNIKSYLISNNRISESIVSSYFIECLLYNVHDKYYLKNNVEERFSEVLNYLLKEPNFQIMKTQDKQNNLFGTSNQQWDINYASKFLDEINSLNR